jgi:cell division protein FtsL
MSMRETLQRQIADLEQQIGHCEAMNLAAQFEIEELTRQINSRAVEVATSRSLLNELQSQLAALEN